MTDSRRRRVRVVVVEASQTLNHELVRCLEADGDIEVVGSAYDARGAAALVEEARPDVVTVDLLASDGHGRQVIERLMGYSPTPILALSTTVSDRHSAPAIEALMAGALDAMSKPSRWGSEEGSDLRRRVRLLDGTPVIRHPRGRLVTGESHASRRDRSDQQVIVALAASTGGPPALAEVIAGLAGVGAPVLVVQHIDPDFVDDLAAWLRRVSPIPVHVARHGDRLEPNNAYVAPGGTHLRIADEYRIALDPRPELVHRPSANELFFSLARLANTKSVAALLTGMGDDGAEGLLAIRDSGGFTIAQDAATSAVHGMPAAAERIGAACRTLPLEEIAKALVAASNGART